MKTNMGNENSDDNLLVAHTLPGRTYSPHPKPANKCAQDSVSRQCRE